MHPNEEVGDLTISYKTSNFVTPVSVTVSNMPQKDVIAFLKTGTDKLQSDSRFETFSAIAGNDGNHTTEESYAAKLIDEGSSPYSMGAINESPQDEDCDEQDNVMSDLSRNEIQALLKANKAEVDALASSMQADMAKWRELMASDIKEMKHLVVTQHQNINSRLDVQSTKIESALESHSKKIDAALSVQEAKLEGKLSDVKLDIIKWALGLPALAFTVYKIYGAISGIPTP